MTMSNLDTLSTNDLFHSALEDSVKASTLSPLGDDSQVLVQAALLKLRTLSARVDTLALFSPNEKFEELPLGSMPYMMLHYIVADLELGSRAIEPEDRLARIRRAVLHLKSFLSLLDDYEVVSEDDRRLYTQNIMDPTSVRAAKISQFKKEKELRSKVEAQQKRRGIAIESNGTRDYSLILGLLPQKEAKGEDEEDLRELFTSVLRLFYAEAQRHLSNAVREVELLRSASPRPPTHYTSQASRPSTSADETWKLDTLLPLGGPDGKGPLLDQQGKPLRSFTILPSGATDRARLQAEVFKPDHNLPTMTIDEYLEEERRQGNVITGGGKTSENKPTNKEVLQEASEMDGTVAGEKKSEQKRREEEEWALFTERGNKVVVAMSGGVDSSVTAALLAQNDYDLSAVFMRNWDTRDESGTDRGCEWEKDWEDVQRVCKVLDIPCDLVDLSQAYWNHVFQPSLDHWSDGLTPNPDVFCNREVKFGALMRSSPVRSSRWLATGHYARIGWNSNYPHRPKLLRAKDRTKDQTYYLSNIPEDALQKSLFPIGDLFKSEVRELALKYKLPTAQRAESMGICFVGKRKHFSGFIGQYIPSRPGDIVDLEGRKLAGHQGIWSYTIGENARIPGMRKRMFVAKKDPISNHIIVVDSPTHPALMCRYVQVSDFRWVWRDMPAGQDGKPIAVSTQIRHVMHDTPATMEVIGAGCQIHFKAPIQGVAPGQVAAVWQGDWCLGAGIITSTHCEVDLNEEIGRY